MAWLGIALWSPETCFYWTTLNGSLCKHKVRADGVRLRNMQVQQVVRYRYIMGLLTLAVFPPGLSDDSKKRHAPDFLFFAVVPLHALCEVSFSAGLPGQLMRRWPDTDVRSRNSSTLVFGHVLPSQNSHFNPPSRYPHSSASDSARRSTIRCYTCVIPVSLLLHFPFPDRSTTIPSRLSNMRQYASLPY